MTNPICSTVFDSRDCIDYLEYLEQELVDNFNTFFEEERENNEDLEEASDIDEVLNSKNDDSYSKFFTEYELEIQEYLEVKDFFDELEQYSSDWKYGSTIIHEDYFTEYSEDLCKEIGDIPKDLPWYIANHIDWDAVADELKVDYSSVTYENSSYYIR